MPMLSIFPSNLPKPRSVAKETRMNALLLVLFVFTCWTMSANAETEHPNRYALVEMTIARRHSEYSRDANVPLGTITIELYADTPETSFNFAKLAVTKFKEVPFHRIIGDFMMQGGDFTARNGTGGKPYKSLMLNTETKMKDENFKHKHSGPYMLSMANSGPNTNGSQFFITFKETSWLDGRHVVFGRVIKGQETIDEVNKIVKKANDKDWGFITIQEPKLTYESEAFKAADKAFNEVLASTEGQKEL